MPNTTTRRYYANFAPQQQLALPITSGATTLTISSSFAGWPVAFPFYAVINYGQVDVEIVRIDAITGTTATLGERGSDGSGAQSHSAGATLDAVFIRKDLDEANAHSSATSAVHGAAGNVVGTTDVQTLSNKTLTAPAINGGILDAASTIDGISGTQIAADHATLAGLSNAWTSFTPTMVDGTWAVTSAAYRLVGKTLQVRISATKTGTAISTVGWATLPASLTAKGNQALAAAVGSNLAQANIEVPNGSNTINLNLSGAAGGATVHCSGVIEVN